MRSVFQRLSPDSIGGRLALSLLIIASVSHVASAAVVSSQRNINFLDDRGHAAMKCFIDAIETSRSGSVDCRHFEGPSVLASEFHVWTADRNETAESDSIIDSDLTEVFAARLDESGLRFDEVFASYETTEPQRLASRTLSSAVVHLAARSSAGDKWINGRFQSSSPPAPMILGDTLVGIGLTSLLSAIAAIGVALYLTREIDAVAQEASRLGSAGGSIPLPDRGTVEVRKLIQLFNSIGTRVDALLLEKDFLLGALGHDLRTPLTSLRIRVEGMQPAEARQRAVESIEEMAAVLEDIRRIARANYAKELVERVDLRRIVESVVADYRSNGKTVFLEDVYDVEVVCNSASIRRTVRNLIDNATNYAGEAFLSLRKRGNLVEIVVEDNGPGIPEELLNDIVNPFVRGTLPPASGQKGSGLGLAIAHAVAGEHNGTLRIENRKPNGLRVAIAFPAE